MTDQNETDTDSKDDAQPEIGAHDWSATPVSARRDPWWLNTATIKGFGLGVAGVVILAKPDTDQLARPVLGGLFLVWALSELWFAMRPLIREGKGVVGAAGGIGFRFWAPILTVGAVGVALVFLGGLALTVVIGIVMVVRGLLALLRLRHHDSEGSRKDRALMAALVLMVGVVLIAVPDAAVLALRAAIGVACLVIAGILISMGLAKRDGSPRADLDIKSAGRLVSDWLSNRRIQLDQRRGLTETLFFEPPNRAAKLGSFWVMMILATTIASFAVVQDSTAVVIGAMLVAPLMIPIMGVAAAAVNGWGARLGRSLLLVMLAVLVAIAVAWLIAAWLPAIGQLSSNSQITSRVEPTLVDFCIAVAAGAAGAYATVDPRVSSSLSGVAIAVALVPPLSVVGITLEKGEVDMALGALLLFLTNFVSIVLTATLVFVMMGFAVIPPTPDQRSQLTRVVAAFGIGALVLAVPLSTTSLDTWRRASDEKAAEEIIEEWLPADDSIELVNVAADGEEIEITVTGPKLPANSDQVRKGLEVHLDHPVNLRVRLIPSTITQIEGS